MLSSLSGLRSPETFITIHVQPRMYDLNLHLLVSSFYLHLHTYMYAHSHPLATLLGATLITEYRR